MIDTKYFCDVKKCRKEVKSNDDLFTVNIIISRVGYAKRTNSLQVCTDCALKLGFIKLDLEEHKPSLAPADEFYGLVTDMIDDSVSDALSNR